MESKVNKFLTSEPFPYCPGCGHHFIAKNTALALEKLNLDPLDVILVTDIGCHGIIDKCFSTHTIHGIHGRSTALATGVRLGLDNPHKKVFVFIGDGGVTIGLQHIMDAARANVDLTVVVHNNLLYGMTGGQSSRLAPPWFKGSTTPEGSLFPHYDICKLSATAGAAYVYRLIGKGDFSDVLAEAIGTEGFSLVEVLEICTSYGIKFNKGVKLEDIVEKEKIQLGKLETSPYSKVLSPAINKKNITLLDTLKVIEGSEPKKKLEKFSIVLAGSAGEGVQSAALCLAETAIREGLEVSKKGSYPVTVGVGFSQAELVLSSKTINFHSIEEEPDVLILTSKDGLNYNKKLLGKIKNTLILADESLELPPLKVRVERFNFRQLGAKNAIFFALAYWLKKEKLLEIDTYFSVLKSGKLGKKLPLDKFQEILQEI